MGQRGEHQVQNDGEDKKGQWRTRHHGWNQHIDDARRRLLTEDRIHRDLQRHRNEEREGDGQGGEQEDDDQGARGRAKVLEEPSIQPSSGRAVRLLSGDLEQRSC